MLDRVQYRAWRIIVVGVEYILIEKVGVGLHQCQKNLRSQRLKSKNQVNALEQVFVSRWFSQIGRLYYQRMPSKAKHGLHAERGYDDDALGDL